MNETMMLLLRTVKRLVSLAHKAITGEKTGLMMFL